MTRKLLTENQTDLVRSIRTEIKSRIYKEVTLTDVLDAILNKNMLELISAYINQSNLKKEELREIEQRRKEYNVYRGDVLSNGLHYKAIVATRNKTELQILLCIDERQATHWIKSEVPMHYDITLAAPGVFFGCMSTVRGRPSAGHYTRLNNIVPIKGIIIHN